MGLVWRSSSSFHCTGPGPAHTANGSGQGSSFLVILPSAPVVRHGRSGRSGGRGAGRRPLGPRGPRREDDADTRELVRDILTQRGAIVTDVCSAAESLASLEQHTPDVILSDIAMPEQDGYAMMRQIAADDSTRRMDPRRRRQPRRSPGRRSMGVAFLSAGSRRTSRSRSTPAHSSSCRAAVYPRSLNGTALTPGGRAVQLGTVDVLTISSWWTTAGDARHDRGLPSRDPRTPRSPRPQRPRGDRALSLEPFQPVVLDLNMPDIGGIEVLEFVRGQEGLRTLPIVWSRPARRASRKCARGRGLAFHDAAVHGPDAIQSFERCSKPGRTLTRSISPSFSTPTRIGGRAPRHGERAAAPHRSAATAERVDRPQVPQLFRALHPIKGLSAMVGVSRSWRSAHRMEGRSAARTPRRRTLHRRGRSPVPGDTRRSSSGWLHSRPAEPWSRPLALLGRPSSDRRVDAALQTPTGV